jgi:hypothetical protein
VEALEILEKVRDLYIETGLIKTKNILIRS